MVNCKIKSQLLIKMSQRSGFTLLVICMAIAPSTAHAYIDPGSGSMFLQLLIAAIAGGLFTLKIYWQRLKDRFGFGRKPGESGTENSNDKS
jgi:drug/metabolite transporter (DMT)-like permease